MSNFNDILLRLIGSGQLTRKKIADVCKCSLSHVDQVFRGESDWRSVNDNGVNEWEALIKMGFELEIQEICGVFIPKGYSLMDWNHIELSLNGKVDDEICEIVSLLGKAQNKKFGKKEKERAHLLIEQLGEEQK